MRKFLMFISIGLVLAAGLLLDGISVNRDVSEGLLCVDVLHLQTDLPTATYSVTDGENAMSISKNGMSYVTLYPMIRGLDLQLHDPKLTLAFSVPGLGWKVYSRPRGDGKSLYAVQSPLPLLVFSSGNDAANSVEIEAFIKGLRPVRKCPKQVEAKKVVSRMDLWVQELSAAPKAMIEVAYSVLSAPYRKNISVSSHMAAPYCAFSLIKRAIGQMSVHEREALLALYNMNVKATAQSNIEAFFLESLHGQSGATVFIEDHLVGNLQREFTRAEILRKDSRLGPVVVEAGRSRGGGCEHFNIPEEYKK